MSDLILQPYRVIIAGTRTFNDYELLFRECDRALVNRHPDIRILCGLAKGADMLGYRYAHECSYAIEVYPAQWKKYFKRAGPMRNEDMARNADALIAFWDGYSSGTRNMIWLAKQYNLKTKIVMYGNGIYNTAS